LISAAPSNPPLNADAEMLDPELLILDDFLVLRLPLSGFAPLRYGMLTRSFPLI
jgi:hypothetical protein